MANDDNAPSARVRWARLRFQILGPVMAAPAEDGELKARLDALARAPVAAPDDGRGHSLLFQDPRAMVVPRARRDRSSRRPRAQGPPRTQGPIPASALRWTKRSLSSIATTRVGATSSTTTTSSRSRTKTRVSGPYPGYATVCRFMKAQGLSRARKRRHRETPDGGSRSPPRETPLVRGHACPRPLASGLSRRLAPRPSPPRANGKNHNSSVSSTTTPASVATCSGISRREPPSPSSTRCRRRASRSAACRARS